MWNYLSLFLYRAQNLPSFFFYLHDRFSLPLYESHEELDNHIGFSIPISDQISLGKKLHICNTGRPNT